MQEVFSFLFDSVKLITQTAISDWPWVIAAVIFLLPILDWFLDTMVDIIKRAVS